MKRLCIILPLLCYGCSTTVPVAVKFPDAPKELLEQCEPLQTISSQPTISEFTKVVVNNYERFHICANRHNGLVEWYNQQKQNFKELK